MLTPKKIKTLNILSFSLILIILLLPLISARSIENIAISDVLNEDLSLEETMVVEIINNSQNFIEFSLPPNAYDVFLNDTFQSKNKYEDNIIVNLNCKSCKFILSYKVDNFIQKINSNSFSLSKTLEFPINPKQIEYTIKLPSGNMIASTDYQNTPAIVPHANAIKTDGKSIIIVWVENQPELPKRYYINYQNQEVTENILDEFKTEIFEWPILILLLLAFLIGVISTTLTSNKFKRNKNNTTYIPSSLLNPDEKIVIQLLIKNNNKLSQKNIGKELNWSKSKVSAIMTNLQYKEIIKREKLGRNYKVELIKKIDYK